MGGIFSIVGKGIAFITATIIFIVSFFAWLFWIPILIILGIVFTIYYFAAACWAFFWLIPETYGAILIPLAVGIAGLPVQESQTYIFYGINQGIATGTGLYNCLVCNVFQPFIDMVRPIFPAWNAIRNFYFIVIDQILNVFLPAFGKRCVWQRQQYFNYIVERESMTLAQRKISLRKQPVRDGDCFMPFAYAEAISTIVNFFLNLITAVWTFSLWAIQFFTQIIEYIFTDFVDAWNSLVETLTDTSLNAAQQLAAFFNFFFNLSTQALFLFGGISAQELSPISNLFYGIVNGLVTCVYDIGDCIENIVCDIIDCSFFGKRRGDGIGISNYPYGNITTDAGRWFDWLVKEYNVSMIDGDLCMARSAVEYGVMVRNGSASFGEYHYCNDVFTTAYDHYGNPSMPLDYAKYIAFYQFIQCAEDYIYYNTYKNCISSMMSNITQTALDNLLYDAYEDINYEVGVGGRSLIPLKKRLVELERKSALDKKIGHLKKSMDILNEISDESKKCNEDRMFGKTLCKLKRLSHVVNTLSFAVDALTDPVILTQNDAKIDNKDMKSMRDEKIGIVDTVYRKMSNMSDYMDSTPSKNHHLLKLAGIQDTHGLLAKAGNEAFDGLSGVISTVSTLFSMVSWDSEGQTFKVPSYTTMKRLTGQSNFTQIISAINHLAEWKRAENNETELHLEYAVKLKMWFIRYIAPEEESAMREIISRDSELSKEVLKRFDMTDLGGVPEFNDQEPGSYRFFKRGSSVTDAFVGIFTCFISQFKREDDAAEQHRRTIKIPHYPKDVYYTANNGTTFTGNAWVDGERPIDIFRYLDKKGNYEVLLPSRNMSWKGNIYDDEKEYDREQSFKKVHEKTRTSGRAKRSDLGSVGNSYFPIWLIVEVWTLFVNAFWDTIKMLFTQGLADLDFDAFFQNVLTQGENLAYLFINLSIKWMLAFPIFFPSVPPIWPPTMLIPIGGTSPGAYIFLETPQAPFSPPFPEVDSDGTPTQNPIQYVLNFVNCEPGENFGDSLFGLPGATWTNCSFLSDCGPGTSMCYCPFTDYGQSCEGQGECVCYLGIPENYQTSQLPTPVNLFPNCVTQFGYQTNIAWYSSQPSAGTVFEGWFDALYANTLISFKFATRSIINGATTSPYWFLMFLFIPGINFFAMFGFVTFLFSPAISSVFAEYVVPNLIPLEGKPVFGPLADFALSLIRFDNYAEYPPLGEAQPGELTCWIINMPSLLVLGWSIVLGIIFLFYLGATGYYSWLFVWIVMILTWILDLIISIGMFILALFGLFSMDDDGKMLRKMQILWDAHMVKGFFRRRRERKAMEQRRMKKQKFVSSRKKTSSRNRLHIM